MKKTTIVIADDDPQIAELLRTLLELQGWKVLTAGNGRQAVEIVENEQPSLVVLDIMLPGVNGFEVCRKLRESHCSIPIIALSGKLEEKDRIKCLDLGADDFIVKPFNNDELVARIKAALRRPQLSNTTVPQSPFKCRDIEINYQFRQVFFAGKEVRLTPTEYRLLVELTKNAGKTVTYTQLLESVWGVEFKDDRQYIHVNINHLRKKLERDTTHRYIISQPRVGYRFE